MPDLHDKYDGYNSQEGEDPFTVERYEQFFKFLPKDARNVLDVGCNTGRGGKRLTELRSTLILSGIDCVQKRLDTLPECYSQKMLGVSTSIPANDQTFDVIVAGECLEHLYPGDVDESLCEFQRVLKIGGRLLLTTPNPNYLRNKIHRRSVYDKDHLTQHYPRVLKFRLMMHGFSTIKIYGSGKVSQYFGYYFPILQIYGSYLVIADKY